nr:hypothetical protein BAR15_160020 [Bartonella sp. AR 15-3]
MHRLKGAFAFQTIKPLSVLKSIGQTIRSFADIELGQGLMILGIVVSFISIFEKMAI